MGRRTTRFGALLVAAGTVFGSALLGAGPAQAADVAPGFYKPAFTDTITRVALVDGKLTHHAVGYQEWQEAGFPAPQPSPTEYVKYAWAPYIAAVTYWPDGLQWDGLDGAAWQRAGSPKARTADYIAGTTIDKYATSSELIARTPDGATTHKLTGQEWAAMGSPAPAEHPQQAYYVRTWNSSVVFCNYALGPFECVALTADRWNGAGQPTPQRVPLVTGDQFSQRPGSKDIYVYGFGLGDRGHLMTAAEWRAAGSPVPTLP